MQQRSATINSISVNLTQHILHEQERQLLHNAQKTQWVKVQSISEMVDKPQTMTM